MGSSNARIKINVRTLSFVLLIGLIVAFSIFYLYNFKSYTPLTSVIYHGNEISFRDDLREAVKVPVFPSKNEINSVMMNPSVKNVTILYKLTESSESMYAIESFEIIFKLKIAYLSNNMNVTLNVQNITSYENLKGNPENPIIALVHPIYSNETAVRVEDHTIFIKGKNDRDFDLATINFLVGALDINVTST